MSSKAKEVNVSESGEKAVNTRRLQIFSLNHFMLSELNAVFDGVCFTDVEFGTQYSFEHAVRLFNEREDKDVDGYVVDSVKLRYCKKSKAIICTSHWVKPNLSVKEICEEEGLPVFTVLYRLMKQNRLR